MQRKTPKMLEMWHKDWKQHQSCKATMFPHRSMDASLRAQQRGRQGGGGRATAGQPPPSQSKPSAAPAAGEAESPNAARGADGAGADCKAPREPDHTAHVPEQGSAPTAEETAATAEAAFPRWPDPNTELAAARWNFAINSTDGLRDKRSHAHSGPGQKCSTCLRMNDGGSNPDTNN